MSSAPRALVIACGALAREVLAVLGHHGLDAITVECLPARLHNEPDRIPDAVAARIERARAAGYDRVLVAYADCGTGGRLARVCADAGVELLDGPHCYQFFAGADAFAALHDEEPGTLYLTDFLARHFDRLVWEGLGLADHPELLPVYFANYTRLVHLVQADDPEVDQLARSAAGRLGLRHERRVTGYGELEPALLRIGGGPAS